MTFVTCDLYLSHSAVAPLCVCPDLHHVVPLGRQGQVDVQPAGCVEGAEGMALLPVQDLGTHKGGGQDVRAEGGKLALGRGGGD